MEALLLRSNRKRPAESQSIFFSRAFLNFFKSFPAVSHGNTNKQHRHLFIIAAARSPFESENIQTKTMETVVRKSDQAGTMKRTATPRRLTCPLCGEVSRMNSGQNGRAAKDRVWKCPYCGQKWTLRREIIQPPR
jgi:DNA-directed RNA polymerase subunit M/transcription elongation factor TFIIS